MYIEKELTQNKVMGGVKHTESDKNGKKNVIVVQAKFEQMNRKVGF